MEYSSNYKKKLPPRGKKRKKRVNKQLLMIVLACIAVIALLVGGFFGMKHYRAAHPASGQVFVPADSTADATDGATEDVAGGTTGDAAQTDPSSTEAQTTDGAKTDDVTITPYTATMYSTVVTLNVRSIPSADGDKLGMVGQDTPLSVTGRCSNGWYRIDYNGGVGYVSGNYVAEKGQTTAASAAPYLIRVNRKQNIVIVYSKDANGQYTVPTKAMVCSVGMDGKTPTGKFTTSDRYKWRLLSGNVYGQYATRISGPYLFHSVPYFTQNKNDLEYDEYNKLGEAASLGCIRLAVVDAKWIYDNCPVGTPVEIYDSDEKEPLEKPTPIRIDTTDSRRGWDPTDPDSKNPWKS